MVRIGTLIILVTLLLAGGEFPATAVAAPGDRACGPAGKGCGTPGHRCDSTCRGNDAKRPYGDYCCNQQRGWYGARREVTDARQARSILENYFTGRNVTIGPFRERPMFFEAEIFDRSGKAVDKVIVHKRSGRIRSIY